MCEEEIRRICVRTSNRFQILEDMGDDEDDMTRDERISMGYSIMRNIDRTLCSKKTKTTTVCLLGARVQYIRKRVGKVMGPGKGGGGGGGGGGSLAWYM